MTNNIPATDHHAIIIENPDRRRIALASLKARLKIEIKTGMKAMSRGASTLQYTRAWGYDGPNRKEKALEWVEAELAKY